MPRIWLTGFSVLFSILVFAQHDDSLLIRKIADEILVNGKAYDNLHVLTKTVGPRLSGSAQTYQAEDWGKKALLAAGADNVWLQECRIPHWVRGGKDEGSMIVDNKQSSINVLALGNSVGTGPAGLNAPVILINSFDDLERRKDE